MKMGVTSGVSRNREKGGAKPKGAAPSQGRTLPRGAASQNTFFRLRCWQPLPAENHLLRNEVAEVGIEGEINAEVVWPLRCRF